MNLQAFWLDAVRYGISVQPVSQMLEDKAFLVNSWRKTLGLNQPPQMILRAGYVDDYGEIIEFAVLSANLPARNRQGAN